MIVLVSDIVHSDATEVAVGDARGALEDAKQDLAKAKQVRGLRDHSILLPALMRFGFLLHSENCCLILSSQKKLRNVSLVNSVFFMQQMTSRG